MITAERLDFLQGEQPAPDRRTRRDRWPVNDSGLDNYFDLELADHPEGVLGIIEEQLGTTEGNAGLDIAGGHNGVAARQLLHMGILDHALVTNYRDRRNLAVRLNPALKHARGNITAPRTWGRILNWQERIAPDGLALVMHRPDGGMQDLSPDFYRGAVHLLLDIMRPGGILFTQVPYTLRHRHAALLNLICATVTGRPDVESVLSPSPAAIARAQGPRQREDCVVIVKS